MTDSGEQPRTYKIEFEARNIDGLERCMKNSGYSMDECVNEAVRDWLDWNNAFPEDEDDSTR